MNYKVTYGKSVHGKDEIIAVTNVLKSGTQMGKNVHDFEKSISRLTDKKYTLMVNSGSSACLLLSEILNLKKGDEFIIPAVNFPTPIVPFLKKGLIPRIVDIEKNTLQIDINKINEKITKKTKLIIIPNLIGNVPRWDLIKKLINKKIIIVEDSADTLSAKIEKKYSGSYSDFTITSFYGSHVINCAGNGGALSLNDSKLYNKAKIIRSWGRLSSLVSNENKSRFNFKLGNFFYDKKFVFTEMGYNLEPSEIGAAFGLVQLKKLKRNIKIRVKNFYLHYDFFKKYSNFFIMPEIDPKIYTGFLAYPLILKEDCSFKRKHLQIFLEKNKIQTRPIFTGNILSQPAFQYLKKFNKTKYSNADLITKNGILLGLHHGLTKHQIDYMHNKVKSFLDNI